MNLLWLLLYPAAGLVAFLLLACVYAWELGEPKRRARRLIAEDRQVAALDAVWELPAREHA